VASPCTSSSPSPPRTASSPRDRIQRPDTPGDTSKVSLPMGPPRRTTPSVTQRPVAKESTVKDRIVVATRLAGLAVGLLFFVGCATTQDVARGGALERARASKTLTFGYRESSVPFSFVGPDGKPTGYSVELCKRVALDLGRELQIPDLALKWAPVTVEN